MSARSALHLPDDAGGLEERIKQQRRRVERVLAFLLEVEGAVRQDLDLLCRDYNPEGPRWKAELERAAELRREAQAVYGGLAKLQGRELLEMLLALDLDTATAALQALRDRTGKSPVPETTTARPGTGSLAPRPGAPGPGHGAAPLAPGTNRGGTGALAPGASRGGTGSLPARGGDTWAPTPRRGTTAPLPPSVRTAQPGAYQRDRAAAGLADRAFLHGRKGFEAAYRLGTELLSYVTPRLTMVQAALGVTGLPGPRRPWEEVAAACPQAAASAGIVPPMVPWVPKLAKLFHGQVDVARKAFVAVNHWKTASQLHKDAEVLAGRLGTVPPATEAVFIQNFPTGRYYGSLFPLCNLHLHFEGVPHMGKLFPPREIPKPPVYG